MKESDLEKAHGIKKEIKDIEWFLDIIEGWQRINEVGNISGAKFQRTYTSKDIEVPPDLVPKFLEELRRHYIEKQAKLEKEFADL